jgi:hypothetical protein
MTVTADRAGARKPGARAAGRAGAAPVEHRSRADRVAQGKDARAIAPLESHAEVRRSLLSDRRRLLEQFTLVQVARKAVGSAVSAPAPGSC